MFVTILFFVVSISLAISAPTEMCVHFIDVSLAGLDAVDVQCDTFSDCDIVLEGYDGRGNQVCRTKMESNHDQPKITDQNGSPWTCSMHFVAERDTQGYQTVATLKILDDDGVLVPPNDVCVIDLVFQTGDRFHTIGQGNWWSKEKCLSSKHLEERWTRLTKFTFTSKTHCWFETTTTDAQRSLTTSWFPKNFAPIEMCVHTIDVSLASLDARKVPCDDYSKCDIVLEGHNGHGTRVCRTKMEANHNQPKITDENGSPWTCTMYFVGEKDTQGDQTVATLKILDDDGEIRKPNVVCVIDLVFQTGDRFYTIDLGNWWNQQKCQASGYLKRRFTTLTNFTFTSKPHCWFETTATDAQRSLTTSWFTKTTLTDEVTKSTTTMETSTKSTDVTMPPKNTTIMKTSGMQIVETKAISTELVTLEKTSTNAVSPMIGAVHGNGEVMSTKPIWVSVGMIAFVMLAILSCAVILRFNKRNKTKAIWKLLKLPKIFTRDIVPVIDRKTKKQVILSNTNVGDKSQSMMLRTRSAKVERPVPKTTPKSVAKLDSYTLEEEKSRPINAQKTKSKVDQSLQISISKSLTKLSSRTLEEEKSRPINAQKTKSKVDQSLQISISKSLTKLSSRTLEEESGKGDPAKKPT